MPHRTTQHTRSIDWSPANRQEAFWTLVDGHLRQITEDWVNQALEALAEEAAGAAWHQRSPSRQAWRNGHRVRRLLTRHGLLRLTVPRLRGPGLDTSLVFERYQRRQQDVDRVLLRAYVLGVSTRGTAELSEQLFGDVLSHETVSRLGRWLDGRLAQYRRRPIPPLYRVVQLDGLHLGVRGGDQMAVLAVGLREDGGKEVLGFSLAAGEQCRALLWDLRRRGLKGVELFTSDGSGAIESALAEVYPEVPRQQCSTHRLRGLLERLGRAPEGWRMVRDAGRIFRSSSRSTAAEVALAWEKRWWRHDPQAVVWFMGGLSESLMFYDLPQRWWRAARTTNRVERLIRTLRMRLRPMGTFHNRPAAERALFGQLLRWHLTEHITHKP
jgi:transposase-like protein